ncbi:carboxypeptidase regulatory-like domain-containing protein [Granulicella arctica]|uniref:TonB-dependent transporter Oar-like beta-barrel domain-containing protein n=1 Tax=Granulicella arctica TaxID=940613 RepID=A0A7Y9PI30_9BACT|nr:TonB-dependent receptor [Granulicella arctica]NYF80317.1 hypothetical protein [Granulicella arctica]
MSLRSRIFFGKSLLFLLLLSSVKLCLSQQTLGGLTGVVTDGQGGILPGTTITATGDQTGLKRTQTAAKNGFYEFPNLPIGAYTLTFTQDGFQTARFPGVVVQADRTATVNVSLTVGSVTSSVTVEATPLMNAVDTTNGYIMDKQQIESVPLPTGSFTGLAILSPGVNAELTSGTGANTGLGNAPIWANGQRDTSNSFYLNGVDASNLFNGKSTSQVSSARVVNNTGVGNSGGNGVMQTSASVYLAIGEALPTPAPETLAEVRVNTSMYDAQQGSTSGAHLDMSTASGTNSIHGSAYVHRGTDWINAAPFFFKQDDHIPDAQKVPQLHRYSAGATAGAPIIKDKLFLFLSYQHTHVSDQEIGDSRLTVPNNLTDDRSPGALAGIANANFPSANTTTSTIYSTPPVTPGAISPVAYALFNYKLPNGQYLIPSATGSAPTYTIPDNAFIPGTAYFIADQAVANLDYTASAKDALAFKYYYQHDPGTAPYAFSNVSGFGAHIDAGSQVASISNTYTLKSNLSTTQTLGFMRQKAYVTNDQLFGPNDIGGNSAASINTFGSSYFPGISIIDVFGNNSPANTGIGANGVSQGPVTNATLNIGAGGQAQSAFTGVFQNRLMPSTNAIWTLGRHTLTFGGSYAYTQLNTRDRRNNMGQIATADFAQFLQGQVTVNDDFTTTSILLGNANRYYRANQVGTYLQDKFQVTPTLSLTAGIRYDWNGGLTEKNGRIYNFDPSAYSFNATTGELSSSTSNGFIIAGNNAEATQGVSNTTLTGRQWGIAPRLGFAWSPAALKSKIVVRGGTGIYYDRGELFTYLSPGYAAGQTTGGPFGVNQSPPFVNTKVCSSVYYYQGYIPTCDPAAGYSIENPWGASILASDIPTGKASDISKYLPGNNELIAGAQPYTLATYDRANKLPYTINYTLDMQWQPRNDLAITLGYVGNLGRHQVIPIPFNQAGTATPSNVINGQQYTYGYSLVDVNFNPIQLPNQQGPYQHTYEGGNIDLRVPYVGYSAESESYRAAGVSAYNALTAHVEKRMSHGVQVGFSYTFSHALDEQSGLGLFYNGNNPLNLRDAYASSDFDRTHVMNFTYVYRLPTFFVGNTLAHKIVDGWQLQGLTILQSGQPYSIVDYSGAVGSVFYGTSDGITNPIVPLAAGCTAKSALTGHSGAFGPPALNASCFTLPLLNPGGLNGGIPTNDPFETNFTSGQRNIFRQAFQKRADASLVKVSQITDRFALKYTFDVFNLTNTSSFDIPVDNVTQNAGYNDFPVSGTAVSPTGCTSTNSVSTTPNPFYSCPSGLGAVNKTIGSPRQIQMSLQLAF